MAAAAAIAALVGACGSAAAPALGPPAPTATSEAPAPMATSELPQATPTSAPPPPTVGEPTAIADEQATVAPSSSGPYQPVEADDIGHLELGSQVFAAACAGCHGSDGRGSPLGPTLVAIAAAEPDRSFHVAVVTYGTGQMVGRGQSLSPEEIDAVVSYIRLSFVDDREQG